MIAFWAWFDLVLGAIQLGIAAWFGWEWYRGEISFVAAFLDFGLVSFVINRIRDIPKLRDTLLWIKHALFHWRVGLVFSACIVVALVLIWAIRSPFPKAHRPTWIHIPSFAIMATSFFGGIKLGNKWHKQMTKGALSELDQQREQDAPKTVVEKFLGA